MHASQPSPDSVSEQQSSYQRVMPIHSAGETESTEFERISAAFEANTELLRDAAHAWVEAQRSGTDTNNDQRATDLKQVLARDATLRSQYKELISEAFPAAETNDKDYIFITFIMDHLPIGVIGLLLAMIFSAGMSSTAAELSALATTSTVDVIRKERTDHEQVIATKWATVLFGVMALAFAAIFSLFDNLIQAVNILGSLFYGTILGVFLVAFFLKRVGGTAVFIAALITQALILLHFALDWFNVFATEQGDPLELAFLWYNLLAPAVLIATALILQAALRRR